MKKDQHIRRGFTFMETMVVVGAFVILIATAIPSIMNNFFTGRGSVVKDAQDLVHLISLAQSQAASNKLNDHWGINFVQAGTTECNSSRAVDCAIMFKGNDYATRNASYDQIYTLTGNDYFSVLPFSPITTDPGVEGFDTDTVGAEPTTAGWNAEGTNVWTITNDCDGDTVTDEGDCGNNTNRAVYSSTGSSYKLYKDYDRYTSGKACMKFRARVTANNQSTLAFGIADHSVDRAVCAFRYTGLISCWDNTSEVPTSKSFNANTWYYIAVEGNIDTKKYSVWMDTDRNLSSSDLIASNQSFQNLGVGSDALWTASFAPYGNPGEFVDEVVYYQGACQLGRSDFYFNKVSGFAVGLSGDLTSTTTIGISNGSASSSITLNSTGTTLFGSSARYRKKITFDNSSQARNLTDFPVLVHLSSSNFDFSHAQSAGQDIRFYDSDDTTPLSYEIEKWTGSEAWIWVKVPQIDASSATDYIYMHYGDLSLADGQNKNDVWSYYYVMVQHMNDVTSLTINDSTSNAYNGTKNALGPTVETSGKIGEAQYFNNAAARITMSSPFDITGDVLTLEAYIKPVAGLSAGVAVGKTLDGTLNYKWFMGSANSSGAFRPANGMDTASFAPEALMDGTRSITQDAWTYQAFVYRGADKPLGNKGRLDFLNGVKGSLYGTTHVGDIDTANAGYSVVIGNADNGGSPFVGYVDEVRVSNVARSDEYFAAQYMSMNETFNTYGSEEPL